MQHSPTRIRPQRGRRAQPALAACAPSAARSQAAGGGARRLRAQE
jgi:hypothetical protein